MFIHTLSMFLSILWMLKIWVIFEACRYYFDSLFFYVKRCHFKINNFLNGSFIDNLSWTYISFHNKSHPWKTYNSKMKSKIINKCYKFNNCIFCTLFNTGRPHVDKSSSPDKFLVVYFSLWENENRFSLGLLLFERHLNI